MTETLLKLFEPNNKEEKKDARTIVSEGHEFILLYSAKKCNLQHFSTSANTLDVFMKNRDHELQRHQ
ncbi:hypothetical protein BLOT_009296 [Blomia tropicalis]|nr:hypothetical protein BLOT_009296 [Blomia tropicalis]